ncbi:preprotein translocase subunit TatB [Companilactobacillus sp.]|jgi:intracellular sulfur oxidation DsrE/DsrF family protein|uniref:preprotein translocase subunit TatB n=1 Tax=Companilactobacillus sp. TaxID=2767905 RepID=UPI0025B82501|nr:preprotein translocase subunit TatB [Companilactobacillus sp.]MCH4008509.1 preprotein translocase subunit TatB [Companilactobacillus sp.]MCH4051312.1 preprotein translocase subunit TatB [Companilactobacillus sp.]MCH4076452.1 preprotein translocase subunit TatB [Companilactobacillus sp.]MCH4125027.1 preprotein translocase subunit TatB [Companilactobacillus sp.]MCH4131568.1 preprotein translocase subunit TatB [Companilactobacillus sp.]
MAYDVLLTSTEMGSGDKALTENLMLAFIHTLTERKEKPENLVMYGLGVKLAKKNAESLNDLKALADSGVNVLSCGICTDYYEMGDQIGVGGITTMPEVVDILASDNTLVHP